jgi:LysM repeat protein
MRHGTKIGIGVVVVAVGIVCGVFAFGDKKPKTEVASKGAAETSTPAVSPLAAGENTGAVASPQPISVTADADRSLRPHVETPAPEQPKEAAPVVVSKPIEPALPAVTPTPAPAPAPAVTVAPLGPSPAPAADAAMKDANDFTELPPIESAATAAEGPKPAPAMSKPQPSTPKVHVVQAGESYSSISSKYFGSPRYAGLIEKANPGKSARKLYVGAKVNLPPAPAGATTTQPSAVTATAAKPAVEPKSGKNAKVAPVAEPAAPIAPDRAYKVRAGEHWTDLAQRFLGNSNRWPELYELNKERVAHNPHALKSGTTIELPAGVKVTTKPA